MGPHWFFLEISVPLKRRRKDVRFGKMFSSNHRMKGSTFNWGISGAN